MSVEMEPVSDSDYWTDFAKRRFEEFNRIMANATDFRVESFYMVRRNTTAQERESDPTAHFRDDRICVVLEEEKNVETNQVTDCVDGDGSPTANTGS